MTAREFFVDVFALTQFVLLSNGLEYLSESDVQERTSTYCVVAGLQTDSVRLSSDIHILLSSLERTFELEETVSVAILNFRPKSVGSVDPPCIAVYPRVGIDRTCLYAYALSRSISQPKYYDGPIQLNIVTQFVNEHCGTYRQAPDRLTDSGLVRQSILDNLFTVKSSSQRCDRIEVPTMADFFSNYLVQSRPVVIAGGIKHWDAMTRWTRDYLYSKFGQNMVHVKLAPNGEFEGCERASDWDDYDHFTIPEIVKRQLQFPDLVVVRPATLDVSFSFFLDMITDRKSVSKNVSAYLEYSSIPQYMPDLEEDIEELPFVKGLLTRRQLNLWLSDGNTLGKLHFDPFDNLLCQISGTKHVTLYEPHNNTRLYESHIPEALLGFDQQGHQFRRKKLLDSTSMVMSPVDITRPDTKRFPLFSSVSPMHCTIHPGDVLYMPAFWWHEVQSTPDQKEKRNMAVNYWYEPFLTKEFPCPKCKLDINKHYRNLLANHPSAYCDSVHCFHFSVLN
ncbi:bifunctional peptidase and (3S)-lysyl hydroxylase Jmjd7-like [Corticium candelabrum]|uniref:bifunctional peptidase and (3S)-lysyl hydroxylase Jmjd7-like n=1 Tax=Corticium candelabrum TaxID=121492 RepID=UPI002E32D811|nr:bifunctional peptidase and (3S)-lysyl hydroxylase Jmjd7-like [Corticium candelabrum]